MQVNCLIELKQRQHDYDDARSSKPSFSWSIEQVFVAEEIVGTGLRQSEHVISMLTKTPKTKEKNEKCLTSPVRLHLEATKIEFKFIGKANQLLPPLSHVTFLPHYWPQPFLTWWIGKYSPNNTTSNLGMAKLAEMQIIGTSLARPFLY